MMSEPLPHYDLLMTLAEVAATFVGFSMIAGVIRPDSDEEKRRFFRFRHVAASSLACVVVAFMPILIHAFGWSIEQSFLYASIFCLFPAVISPILDWREVGVLSSFKAEPLRTITTIAFNIIMVSLLLINAIAPGPFSAIRYVVFLTMLLMISGLIFIGATFTLQNGVGK
jgi:hypothetical protein